MNSSLDDWLNDVVGSQSTVRLGSVADEVKRPNRGMISENLLSLSYGSVVRRRIDATEGLLPASFEGYNVVRAGDIVLRLTDLQNDKKSLRTGLVVEDGIITSAYTTIRPRGVLPRYLAYQLRAIDLAKVFYALGGGLRQSIGFGDLKALPVAIPELEVQVAVADFLDGELSRLDSLRSNMELAIRLARERRSTLVTEVVSGRLDVVRGSR